MIRIGWGVAFVVTTLVIALAPELVGGATPTVGGDPTARPGDFRVTTFASGLDFPASMQPLSDGSILAGVSVPLSSGGSFFNSTGQLVRLVDVNHDGVADSRQVLADNLPGGITSVRQAGSLVFVSSGGNATPQITVLRKGASVNDAYSNLGSVTFSFPQGWEHTSYALAVRPTPGTLSSYDVFFNVGSQANAVSTPKSTTVNATGLLTAALHGDSIYKVSINANVSKPSFSAPVQIATGLRNAAGIAFHPATGDLYFQDNGIDTPSFEELSADELNRVPAAQIGSGIPDFGFARDYIEYRTGNRVGSGGIQPIVAFQPIPDPNTGAQSAGANELAFAPSKFPAALAGGLFIGFHGEFDGTGPANGEAPVVYVDPQTGKYFHFIETGQPGIGHPDGLLATDTSLFVADLASGSLTNPPFQSGNIYQIESLTHFAPFGDFNGDGTVDFRDLLLLAQHYGQANAGLSTGDANDDGKIDFSDLLVVAQHYGQDVSSLEAAPTTAGAVPEPSLVAVALGACAVMLRRRTVA